MRLVGLVGIDIDDGFFSIILGDFFACFVGCGHNRGREEGFWQRHNIVQLMSIFLHPRSTLGRPGIVSKLGHRDAVGIGIGDQDSSGLVNRRQVEPALSINDTQVASFKKIC